MYRVQVEVSFEVDCVNRKSLFLLKLDLELFFLSTLMFSLLLFSLPSVDVSYPYLLGCS